MSGLGGIVFLDGRDVVDADLNRLVAATPHIGPEGIGSWRNGPAGMLRFRHATTLGAVAETQPYSDPDSAAVICFDGRLDNRADLQQLLGSHGGHDVPDCEIALALFLKCGDEFVSRLVGDYAFAIWQPDRRRLFCARSPMGWRTFLWRFNGREFAFSSQPRTLIDGTDFIRRINEGAIGEYLSCRFVSLTETFWTDLQRLPGGSALWLENGRIRTRHWHSGPFEDFSRHSEADHVERMRSLFDDALVATTRSQAPIFAQLSGGLDSSSVVCRATELHRAHRLDRQVGVITVRYPGKPHDETQWSQKVEKHLGIEAVVVDPQGYSWNASKQWCSDTLHLPLRPNILMGMCEHLNARGARVLLTGEGGDDWLNGLLGHWPDLVRQGRWPELLADVRSHWPEASFPGRLKSLMLDGLGPIISRRIHEKALRPHLDFSYHVPPWINPEWAKRIGLSERWRADKLPVDLPLFSQQQRYQFYCFGRRHVNWDNGLAYADSKGIELRHPFHDRRLTEFLLGAAGPILNKDGFKKHLLREAMRGTLPEDIRIRRDKANFSNMMVDAATDRFRERAPEDLLCVKLGWVDGEKIATAQRAFTAWRDGGGRGNLPPYHYGMVWFALSVDLWLEHAFGI